jgi:hypothetical protein
MHKFLFFCINFLACCAFIQAQDKQLDKPLDMPILKIQDAYLANYSGAAPIEQRSEEYRRFLSVSLKISAGDGSGSGTIVYYDIDKQLAYVASCGHLWSGNMSYDQGQIKKLKCKVTTWYHNEIKLENPKIYDADVIFYSNSRGYDTSLIVFKTDWMPSYFPIAPIDYNIPEGSVQNSLGCDGAKEVARYEVEVVGLKGHDLITKRNSPRPGRSGGGLLNESGYYIGTCWGTSERDGSGIGYFTSLNSIHKIWVENKYGWLLTMNLPASAKTLPIINHSDDKKFDEEYILLPRR